MPEEPVPSPAPPESAKPRRPRRMIVWMIAAPAVILLLAFAGANWRVFHLAYAKRLMRSGNPMQQSRGIDMVLMTHLRVGMSLEEVRAILAPARVREHDVLSADQSPPLRNFWLSVDDSVSVYDLDLVSTLGFDENDRLKRIVIIFEDSIEDIPLPGK
jgi:hypothetical protein